VVEPGSPVITVRGPMPGQKVKVSLRRGTWTESTTVTIASNGQGSAQLRHKGKLIKPKVGDVVTSSVATDAKVTVPPFYVYWSDTGIFGRRFKNAVYSVDVLDSDGTTIYFDLDAAFEDGSWFNSRIVGPDEHVVAWCAKPSGDQLYMVGIKS
jgi:hypothetical protein